MPSFARELEQTLHNALAEASRRRHEYATLEHLLIALIDDEHASKVMTACGVSRDELRASVKHYLDNELGALVADSGTDPTPTSGFQRVVQRAILHVQSSGRDEVTGANVLVALFSERESYAVYFLQHIDTLLHCSKSNDAASCYILTTIAVVPILNEAAPRDTSIPSSGRYQRSRRCCESAGRVH